MMNPFTEELRYYPRHTPVSLTTESTPLTSNKHSHSLSRIQNMTVGDVRQCFSEMRNTENLSSFTVLWCGLTAGQFALQYLVNTTGASRKRRTSYTSATAA